jgi:SAM-dependent methyltransferase
VKTKGLNFVRHVIFGQMSSLDDSTRILQYHRGMIDTHGAGNLHALGWKSSHEQTVRFEALAQIADLNGKTVLDAGCGYADLYLYLKKRFPALAHYCGAEQIQEFVDEAIRRYGHLPDTSFISRSFLYGHLPQTDYVFACGSLNYGSTKPGFIFDAISRLFKTCTLGLAFNLLKSMPADGTLVAYDPEDILAYCGTLSDRVIFKDGYAPEDFTIFMYK